MHESGYMHADECYLLLACSRYATRVLTSHHAVRLLVELETSTRNGTRQVRS